MDSVEVIKDRLDRIQVMVETLWMEIGPRNRDAVVQYVNDIHQHLKHISQQRVQK